MSRVHRYTAAILVIFLLVLQSVCFALPAKTAINKIRTSQTAEKVRIVFDMDVVSKYDAVLEGRQLVVNINNTANKSGYSKMVFNDKVVSALTLIEETPGSLQAIVDLKADAEYKVFTLKSPNRLVIDIIKKVGHKKVYNIAPGITYTDILAYTPAGPVVANIADVDLSYGYKLKPVLSNGVVAGLEKLSTMAKREEAIVSINSSYFNKDGSIIGLFKMDGNFISTADISRTAFGIMPDGNMIIDQVGYKGWLETPDGSRVSIDGVNCERGPNGIILYNTYFNDTTLTNDYGNEYVITNGYIEKRYTNKGNNLIPEGSVILSAHGDAVRMLSKLKIGDRAQIHQTIGPFWDQALHVVGAGPMLVKDGAIHLTTGQEEFGRDVAGGRAPRTALGVTNNGHVLLVVVDGRSAASIGMTLSELALFMQKIGAVSAMNLDGGGSSQMIINDSIVNSPSDGTERRIASAIVVVRN